VLVTTVLALAFLLAWSGRTPNSDLFMSLAGGRDVVDGKLGQADDWSFLTQGDPNRVWINQSWLTHWALYRLWGVAGPTGMNVARVAIMVAWVGGVLIWLRRRRISWAAVLTASAALLLVCRYHMILRGNIVTLAAVPWLLWMLERQRTGPMHWAWAITALLIVWGQAHGGYVYGWGVVLLWLVIFGAAQFLRGQWRWATVVLGLALAVVLTVTISPFGLRAITQSLAMAGKSEWRTVREWWPLVENWSTPFAALRTAFQTGEVRRALLAMWAGQETGPFLLMLSGIGLLVLLVLLRRLLSAGDSGSAGTKERNIAPFLFDVTLTAVTIAMAVEGRRFVPLAATVLTLALAQALDQLLRRPHSDSRSRVGATGYGLSGLSSAALLLLVYPMVALGYSQRHPFLPRQNLFERQVMANAFADDAGWFLRANGIKGNVFHDYGQEGYLRWTVPGCKVYCGGRAQQIYTEADRKKQLLFSNPKITDPRVISGVNELLRGWNVRIVLLPASTMWELTLALIESGEWLAIYFDGDFSVLVNPIDEFERFGPALWQRSGVAIVDPNQNLQEAGTQVRADQVAYPDEQVWLQSYALYLASPRLSGGEPASEEERMQLEAQKFRVRFNAVREAQSRQPNALLYVLLSRMAEKFPSAQQAVQGYFQSELERMKTLSIAVPRGAEVLWCRHYLARLIEARLRRTGDSANADHMKSQADAAADLLEQLGRWWQM